MTCPLHATLCGSTWPLMYVFSVLVSLWQWPQVKWGQWGQWGVYGNE